MKTIEPAIAEEPVSAATTLERVIAMRNAFCRQRENLRDELTALVKAADGVLNAPELAEWDSATLFELQQRRDDADRLLLSLPPKLRVDELPGPDDIDASDEAAIVDANLSAAGLAALGGGPGHIGATGGGGA